MQETPLNFQSAHFLTSAPSLRECPADTGLEVAFAGRSNAGKSSAINAMSGQKSLARTSKTPGRTQLINFFALGEDRRMVDLPGYGYAKVSRQIKTQWDQHLSEYLQRRSSLAGLVLLMDIRHPLQDFDTQMLSWASAAQLPVHILLTKADKLKRGPAKSTLLELRKTLGKWYPGGELFSAQTFSALKKEGIDELQTKLTDWLAEPPAAQ